MFDGLLNGDIGRAPTNFPALLLGLLLALAGGHVIAWVYMTTHSGLSYSRSFVKSIIVMPVVVALVMHVLANNIITAFGMMAVFTIVRFRNMLRDTLDTSYILLVLALGMAAGSQKFTTAVVGLAVMTVALLYLSATSFGSRHRYDLILNLHWSRPLSELDEINRLLTRHTRRSHRASQRGEPGSVGMDISYWLLLRDPDRVSDLLDEMRKVNGVSNLSSIQAEDESEV
ncbi:MAG TPA: DUF4956 domain-containing protein [Verrucomicrobiae bacterium]|jgi:hypothetical protein|nr:DUF4956 domain-containing protein [Verrucomicrobiae bacterium]